MACLAKNIVEYSEFKKLVQESGFTEETVFGLMSLWLDQDPNGRDGKFPSSYKELTALADKEFYTENKDIVEIYKQPFTADRSFESWDDPKTVSEHINRMVTIFGKDNVFVIKYQSGETDVFVAKPVLLTKEDEKKAIDLLLNKIDFNKGVIEKLEDKVRYKRATAQDLKDLDEFRKSLEEAQSLYDGLKDGTSEIYINEYGVSQVRRKAGVLSSQQAPQTSQTIDIWAGSNPTNADLSNMAQRPFTYNGRRYSSVEHAFQAAKLEYAAPIEQQPNYIQTGFSPSRTNLSSFDAKQFGNRIVGLDKARWDADKFGIMKELIKASFQQNPQALQRLLATGDAVLTHNRDRADSPWRTEFPRILMEVRDELRREQSSSLAQQVSTQGKTEQYGVVVTNGSKEFWEEINDGWLSKHPNGIAAYRKHGAKPESFSTETVKEGWIGNPFSTESKDEETVRQFYEWLVTGNNFGNKWATEEFRQAIIDKLLSTSIGAPILYYTELGRPSHATILGYLINHKELIGGKQQLQKSVGQVPVALLPATQQDSEYFNTPTNSSVSTSYEDKPWKEPFKFYSGGEPNGADTAWGDAARQIGIEVKDFLVDDYNSLSDEEKERIDREYSEVVKRLGRRELPPTELRGQLVRRDMMQADNADAIFAVGDFDESFVEGGTAYAVMRGIILGIPVHFFNQSNGTWYTWDDSEKAFHPEDEAPLLTQHAAVIGTEHLNAVGNREIVNTVQRTGRHFGLIKEANKSNEIKLTEEQQKAVDNTVEFILSKSETGTTPSGKKFITIQGMAGTGKTTIVRNIVQNLRDEGFYGDIAVAALSRKAVQVLSSKLKDLGVSSESLYTLAGADYGTSKDQFAINPKKEKFSRYSLIFIDEASMVDKTKMEAINSYIESSPKTVVVFLGDYGQVRPIANKNEVSEKSEVFHRDDIQVEMLTERIRQGEGSPILEYADKFYKVSVGKSQAPLMSKPSGVKSIINDSGALVFAGNIGNIFTRLVDAFRKAIKEKNPNYIKVVSSTNDSVDTLNQRIHDTIFPDAKYDIDAGDLIMFNAPYSIKGKPAVENATEGMVESVTDVETDEYGIKYQDYNIILPDGRSVTVPRIVDEDSNLRLYYSKRDALYKRAYNTKNKADWAVYWSFNDKFADFSLGYAMTIHKAQGSTYDMVVVDELGIRQDGAWQNQERAEIMYTALTRSRNVTVSISGTEDSGNQPFIDLNNQIEKAKRGGKTEEKDEGRPKNRSVRLYVKGQEEKGYFEVVKDFEEGYYSVHFKPTDSNNPNAFSEKEKDILFKAVADVIPVGAYLSTYGTLSRGGVHGINRFANLGFAETGKFRYLRMKGTDEQVPIPIYQKLGQYDDSSVDGRVAAGLAGKTVGQKPAGNNPNANVVSFVETNNFFKTVKTVQMESLPSATTQQVIEALEARIDNDKEQTLTVGTRIIPNTSSTKDFIKSLKALLGVNNTMLVRGKPLPVEHSIKIDNLDKSELKALRRMHLQEENGVFRIPTFIIGISDEELSTKEQRNNLMAQGNFTETELREYAKRAIFKLSDCITRLQNGETALLSSLGDENETKSLREDKKGNPIDYTKMSRIDIIRKIGLGRALTGFVKKPVFEYVIKKNIKFAPKARAIFNNWDAFLELAYDALINLEEITLSDSKGRVNEMALDINEATGEEGQTISAETEMELQEIFGSAVEYWQIGFRQISAFHSLASDIRNRFGKLLDLDAEGKPVIDNFGMEKTVSSADAVAKVLAWTQHAVDLEDMIEQLKKQVQHNPWLRQLVGEGETAYTDRNGEQKVGVLVDKEQSAFQSKFFSNFKKYFQSYTVTYLDNNNNVVMRTVNNSPYEDESIGVLKTLVQNGQLTVFNDKTGKLTAEFKELSDIIGQRGIAPTRYKEGRPAAGLYVYESRLQAAKDDPEGSPLIESDRQDIVDKLYRAYKLLNIDVPVKEVFSMLFSPTDMLKAISSLGYIADGIEEAANIVKDGGYFQLFARKGEKVMPDSDTDVKPVNLTSDYKNLLSIVAPAMTSSREVVSYEGGKLFYAYVTPSYLGLLADKLKGYTGKQSYEDFMNQEYLKYEGMFYNSESRAAKYGPKGHLNYMISRLMDEKDGKSVRGVFDHVTSLTYEGIQYADKTKPQYYASMVSMFLYDIHGKRAYFRLPTMSNKPSEEYIRFERLSADTYERTIVNWLAEKTFYQELNRMKTVADRAKLDKEYWQQYGSVESAEDAKIKNFDRKGRESEFVWMPYLNKYLNGTMTDKEDIAFGKSLKKIVEGKGLNPETNEGKRFTDYLKKVIRRELDLKFEEFIKDAERSGFISYDESGKMEIYQIDSMFTPDNYPSSQDYRRDILREFFWNDHFMSINILQLTVTDISMYDNAEDLQKRLAQLHSPGMRANVNARDIVTGELVSDGKSRYVILKDDRIKSDIVTNLRVALSRALQRAKPNEKAGIRAKYQNIISAFDSDRAINFADAQAFSSPTSYRKKMHWFGKWDRNQEAVYQRVISGDYTEDDLDVLWQPLKPFVYAQITKHSGSEAMPLIKMGIQNKNSEYLLLMADALMRSEKVDSKLGALYDVMEMSQGDWVGEGENRKFVQNGKGIDTFMFESAVKTGLTGIINLNITDLTPHQIRRKLWTGNKALLRGTNEDGYNDIYVHTYSAENYTIQQEIPAHFKGEQQMGSQARIHAIADLADYGVDGKENTIIINSKKVNDKGEYVTVPEEITVKEFKKRYQQAIVENIELSFEELNKELGLNLRSKKLRNVILSKVLKDEIRRDGRFGPDLIWACDTDANGNFNIPLSDPVQSGRIQQLLNSLIKNRINKQEIAGGALVQVTSWGVQKSKELGIRFQREDGKLLYTRKEYDAIIAGESIETKFDRSEYVGVRPGMYDNYEDYVKNNQHRVAYFEAYVSIYDDRLLHYQDSNGIIDVKRIEKEDPQLLEMIGYRIPTEGKYSMVPIKIVGFLPRSGEGIMLPADITLLTGSDFDVDKLYIMRRAISQKKDINKFVSDFMRELQDEQEVGEYLEGEELSNNRAAIIEALNTPESKSKAFRYGKAFYDRVHKAYAEYGRKEDHGLTTHVTDKRAQNNNLIIDYLQAVLTSPLTVDQGFSPGNFDMVKEIGYLVAAYDNLLSMNRDELIDAVSNILNVKSDSLRGMTNSVILEKAFDALRRMDIKQLKEVSYTKVDLLYVHTQAKFHQQNSVAGKLIGVFAQANTSHGFITLMDDPCFTISNDNGFTLNGKSFTGKVEIDKVMSLDKKTRISEVLASLLASSVDAVKDPVLNLFNINMTTVNIAVAMVRLGIPLDTVGWFLTTPIMKEAVHKFEMDNANGNKPLSMCISEMMDEINERNGGTLNYFENKDITTEDLIIWHTRNEELTDAERADLSKYVSNNENDINFVEEFNDNSKNDAELDTQDKIDYQLLGMAQRLLSMADGFRSITHMTRYNSISSAVGPFIANTYVSKASDSNFLSSPIIGETKEKAGSYRDDATGLAYRANNFKKQILENPIIHAFRKYSYSLESALLGDNFIQGGKFGQWVFEAATHRFPNLSNEVALALSEFMVSYAISSIKEKPIFDLSDGESIETTRRRVILNNVPGEVSEAKIVYPNNRFLQVIRTYVEDRTGETVMSVNTRGRDEVDVQDIKVGWTQLYRDEQERIAKTGGTLQDNLAFRIIEYNFFRGGFGFSPKTFMRILPSELKLALPNYVGNLNFDYTNTVSISNLLDQFMLNYGYINLPELDIVELSKETKLPVDAFNEMVVLRASKTLNISDGVTIVKQTDGSYKWAVLRPSGNRNEYRFYYVDKLGGVENQGFEIDPTRNPWNIKSVFTQSTKKKSAHSQNNASTPENVQSYAQFEAIMKKIIEAIADDKTVAAFNGNFSDKIRIMSKFAYSQVGENVSSTFDKIRQLLTTLDLKTITEEKLNELLDENNICR